MAITTRETTATGVTNKGSPLTNAEVDTNFIELQQEKIELTDLSVGAEGDASGDGSIAYDNSTGVFTYTPPADISGAVTFAAQSGEALTKGDVVYVSGVSGNTPVVSKADADDASKMPAFGLAEADANSNAAVNVVTFGTLYNLDTSGFSAGDTVYVSTTAGSLTSTKPSGESSLIQNVGKVIRSHASAGSIKVGGAGRTNDTPNLNDGNVFIGNSSNQVEARALTGDDISGGTITSFASTGIDDNATATRLTVNNGFTEFDATNHYLKFNGSTDSLRIGTTSTGYAYFINDGPSAGTGNSGIAFYDNGSVELWSPAGDAITGNLRINSSGVVTIPSAVLTTADINGGTADGVTIGGSTAAAGTFTTFTSTGIDDNATSTAITIDSDENVGIGIAPSSTYGRLRIGDDNSDINMDGNAKGQFHIDGNGFGFGIALNTSGAQLYTNSASRDLIFGTDETERVRINGSGNLGIANNNPSDRISIIGTGGTAKIRFDGDSSNLQNNFIGITNYDDLIIASDEANTGTASTIQFRVDATERMRLDHDGNLGLGTDDPSRLLHLKADDSCLLQLQVGNTTGNCQILFGDSGSTTVGKMLYIHSSNALAFHTNSQERLRIDSLGNLGVNTDSPNTYLSTVSGSAKGLTIEAAVPVIALKDTSASDDVSYIYQSTNDMRLANYAGGNITFNNGSGFTEYMRITSGGAVGVGSDNPQGKMQITTGTNNIVIFRDASHTSLANVTSAMTFSRTDGVDDLSAIMGWNDGGVALSGREGIAFATGGGIGYSNTVERARIDDSGRFGIGIVPTDTLHVAASTPIFKLESTDASMTTDQVLGAVQFRTNDPSGSGVGDAAMIAVRSASSVGGSYYMAFHTADSSNLNQERLRIEADGRIGIGDPAPPSGTKVAIQHDGTGIRLDGTNNVTRRIFFRNVTAANPAEIVADGSLVLIAEDSGRHIEFKTANTERARIDSSGNFLVGHPNTLGAGEEGAQIGQNGMLTTARNQTSDQTHIAFINPNGQVGRIRTLNNATTYLTASDERLKENIVDAPGGNIDDIRVRSFDWKVDGAHQAYGMIAQELASVAPDAVSQGNSDDDMWGIDYSKLVPMMIKEIQDLKAKVAELESL